VLAQGAVFWSVGLYRGLWRFASVPDLWNISKACLLGMLVILLVLAIYNSMKTFPGPFC
jgi:FlaA1/EpsC-like NDP-sugar epimerase